MPMNPVTYREFLAGKQESQPKPGQFGAQTNLPGYDSWKEQSRFNQVSGREQPPTGIALPGERYRGQDLLPVFALNVQGKRLDVSEAVTNVEYESCLDIADMFRMTIVNPNFSLSEEGFAFLHEDGTHHPDTFGHKAFLPGNELDLFMGYGNADQHIGRVILAKWMPVYPQNGVPTLTIEGYDKSTLMMRNEGRITGASANAPQWDSELKPDKNKGYDKPDKKGGTGGDKALIAQWKGESVPDAVEGDRDTGTIWEKINPDMVVYNIATRYGLSPDIVPLPARCNQALNFMQPRGMSDYELVNILARAYDYDFWVDFDYDHGHGWTLHWKPPVRDAQPTYTFRYGDPQRSNILSFNPEFCILDAITELDVLVWDEATQSWLTAGFVEGGSGENWKYGLGGGIEERTERETGRPEDADVKAWRGEGGEGGQQTAEGFAKDMAKILSSPSRIRIATAGVAIDVMMGPFNSVAEMLERARIWFLAHQDRFVIGKGRLIGVETLRAGQIHRLEGLGTLLDGDWYFTVVRHRMSRGRDLPYTCEFTAHKIIRE